VFEPHVAGPAELDAATLYALLRLRAEVFVVEQECPYLDPDGRDLEPGTRHLWYADGDGPVAYLRLLEDCHRKTRIGRVCVAPRGRGRGYADRLVRAALELIGDRGCVLDSQSYLTGFYGRHGFVASGPEFIEDGIPHVPMVRAGSPPDPRSAAAVR
jgi:ElaA protein